MSKTLIDADEADKMALKFLELENSLLGVTSNTHDSIMRVRGSFARTMIAIKLPKAWSLPRF